MHACRVPCEPAPLRLGSDATRVSPEPAPGRTRLAGCVVRVRPEPAPVRTRPPSQPVPSSQPSQQGQTESALSLRVDAEPGPPSQPRVSDDHKKRFLSTSATLSERAPAETSASLAPKKKSRRRPSSSSATFFDRVPAETEPELAHARPGSLKAEVRQVHVGTGIIAAAALRSSSTGASSHWAEHGCDPLQVKRRLRACVCRSGQCYRDLRFDSVMGLLTGFWKLSHAEQDSFLFTCFASAEDRGSAESAVSDNAAPVRHQYNVMGQRLGVNCFAHLLGIHKRRIYNGLAGKPDGRTFNVHREAPKKASIDFFFLSVWLQHGQTIPEGLVKRGARLHGKYCHGMKPNESDMSDDESDNESDMSPAFVAAQLQSIDRALSDWILSANLGMVDMHHILLTTSGAVDPSRLTTRRLPVGWNVSTLYGDYVAGPGEASEKAQYWLFHNVWREGWSKAFTFSYLNEHPACDACYEHKLALRGNVRGLAVDRVAMVFESSRFYQRHLASVRADRSFCDSLRLAASKYAKGDYLMIFLDGMDQAHWRLPRFPGLRSPSSLSTCSRPTVVVEGVWVVGHGLFFYLLDKDQAHGSNSVLECLSRALECVAADLRRQGKRMPKHLILVHDNTVREMKNQMVFKYWCTHVLSRKFHTVTQMMPRKGHSHDILDQLFGLIAHAIASEERLLCPEDIIRVIQDFMRRPGMQDFMKEARLVVERLFKVHDWQSWSNAFRSIMHGGLLLDETANHFFMFTTRRLLRPEDRAAIENLPHLLPLDDDVVVLVKRQEHRASKELACLSSPWCLPGCIICSSHGFGL